MAVRNRSMSSGMDNVHDDQIVCDLIGRIIHDVQFQRHVMLTFCDIS